MSEEDCLGLFPLLNKNTLVWSVFVISVNGSCILQTNFSTLLSVSSLSPDVPCCHLAMLSKLAYLSQPVTAWEPGHSMEFDFMDRYILRIPHYS